MSSENADYSETNETVITGSFADFLVQYFVFGTTKDEFHDICRQFRDCPEEVSNEERWQILRECRRLSDDIARYSDFRDHGTQSVSDLSEVPGNEDIVRRINLAIDFAQEDRDMANDFSLIVYSKEQGHDRTPRMRKIVNPFVPLTEEKETTEEEEPETEEEPPVETEETATPEATEDGD